MRWWSWSAESLQTSISSQTDLWGHTDHATELITKMADACRRYFEDFSLDAQVTFKYVCPVCDESMYAHKGRPPAAAVAPPSTAADEGKGGRGKVKTQDNVKMQLDQRTSPLWFNMEQGYWNQLRVLVNYSAYDEYIKLDRGGSWVRVQ